MGVKISELDEQTTFDESGKLAIEIASKTEYVTGGRMLAGNFGSYSVWDDLRMPATALKTGQINDPDFAQVRDNGSGSTGVFAWRFDDSQEEELFFAVQLPHKYKLGSNLKPHIHWMPLSTDTGDVVWGIEYTLAEYGSAFGVTSLVTVTDAGDGTAYKHQIASLADIDGSDIDVMSTMLLCRIYRDADNAADTYSGDAALLEFDIHYEIDQAGSSQEFVK